MIMKYVLQLAAALACLLATINLSLSSNSNTHSHTHTYTFLNGIAACLNVARVKVSSDNVTQRSIEAS